MVSKTCEPDTTSKTAESKSFTSGGGMLFGKPVTPSAQQAKKVEKTPASPGAAGGEGKHLQLMK